MLTLPAFSKVVAFANGSSLALQAADGSNTSLFDATRSSDIAALAQGQGLADGEKIPEPATGAGWYIMIMISAKALVNTGYKKSLLISLEVAELRQVFSLLLLKKTVGFDP